MPPMLCLATRLILCSLMFIAAASASVAAPFTVEDLVRLKRLSDPQISPDGNVLAFVQRETDMDANRGRTSLWLLDLREPGAEPQRASGGNFNDSSPRWAQDSRTRRRFIRGIGSFRFEEGRGFGFLSFRDASARLRWRGWSRIHAWPPAATPAAARPRARSPCTSARPGRCCPSRRY